MYKLVNNTLAKSWKNVHFWDSCIRLNKKCEHRNGCFWGFILPAFNNVDFDRLKKVGPDRLCAEWVLKNGGAIGTTVQPNILLKDYNALPPESYTGFYIKIVDVSDTHITGGGLEHFKGCQHIETVIIHNCQCLDGLRGLTYLSGSLQILNVSSCDDIDDSSLLVIGELKNLQNLRLHNLLSVRDMKKVHEILIAQIPNCKMEIIH